MFSEKELETFADASGYEGIASETITKKEFATDEIRKYVLSVNYDFKLAKVRNKAEEDFIKKNPRP